MNDPAAHLADTATTAHQLNQVAQPLGYAITYRAGTNIDGSRTDQTFTVHRVDEPVASGPAFYSAADLKAHLEELAALPAWHADLPTIAALDLRGWDHLGPVVVVHAEQPPTVGHRTPQP